MHMQRRGALAEGALGRVRDFDLLKFLGKGSFGAHRPTHPTTHRSTHPHQHPPTHHPPDTTPPTIFGVRTAPPPTT